MAIGRYCAVLFNSELLGLGKSLLGSDLLLVIVELTVEVFSAVHAKIVIRGGLHHHRHDLQVLLRGRVTVRYLALM